MALNEKNEHLQNKLSMQLNAFEMVNNEGTMTTNSINDTYVISNLIENLCHQVSVVVSNEVVSHGNQSEFDVPVSESSTQTSTYDELCKDAGNSEEQYYGIINETKAFVNATTNGIDSDETRLDSMEPLSNCSPKMLSHNLIGYSQHFGTEIFLKGCKWSPDGLCFLTNGQDNKVRIFNTPPQCLRNESINVKKPLLLEFCLTIQEPETIYDFSWWPLMNSQDPATCCFATTCRDQPVHLWDAFDGHLRASYIALNSVHEISSANSVCFSNDGQQLLCGFKKHVCLFYTDNPGSQCEKWETFKKKQHKSQNNIISCLEFCRDDSVFACGCYDGTVGLYSPVNGHLLDFTAAHNTGVTHLKFSPDGNRLYTGARKGNFVKCWDLRNVSKPVYEAVRPVSTNQRIYFDLAHQCNAQNESLLVSGTTDGELIMWDTESSINSSQNFSSDSRTKLLGPCYTFKAHDDCVNGCSVHPFLPLIVTSSGQRTFSEPRDSDDESNHLFCSVVKEENIVKLWHISNLHDFELSSENMEVMQQ